MRSFIKRLIIDTFIRPSSFVWGGKKIQLKNSYSIELIKNSLIIKDMDLKIEKEKNNFEFLLIIKALSFTNKEFKYFFKRYYEEYNEIVFYDYLNELFGEDAIKYKKQIRNLNKRRSSKLFNPKEHIAIDNKAKKIKLQGFSNKSKLKYNPFEEEALGTLGDFFNKENIIEDNVSGKLKIKKEIKKQHTKNNYEKLVLWDIENVHFFNDFSEITRLLPKDSIKFFSYKKLNHKNTYIKNMDFIVNKLKKRKWIELKTKKIADTKLINEFQKRKYKIKELYLISVDKDFKQICDEAKDLGIKVTIITNTKNRGWFENFNLIKLRGE